MNKVMVVCSDASDVLDRYLRGVGSEITKVKDGQSAIDQLNRAVFDLVIVVSTGALMDVAETVLNLRDIRPSTRIIVIYDGHGMEAEMISRVCPNTETMTLDGLAAYLESSATTSRVLPRYTGQR
jgi:PleD family two-component response regulator